MKNKRSKQTDLLRREIWLLPKESELIQKKAKRAGILTKWGEGSEKGYIEMLVRKDLKRIRKLKQLPLFDVQT